MFFRKRKRKVEKPPIEIGRDLVGLLNLMTTNVEKDVSDQWEDLASHAGERRLRAEVRCVGLAGVEFGVWLALASNDDTRSLVLDGFWGDIRAGLESEFGHEEAEEAMAALGQRAMYYAEAAKKPHQNGPHWTVGSAFGDSIGCPRSIVSTMFGGAVVFHSIAMATSDYINDHL